MKGRALRHPGTLAALILAGALLGGVARAQSPDLDAPAVGILPPSDILAGVRYIGLDPVGQPVRRGAYYVLHAFDATGVELRVVADAQFGDILFMGPALNASLTPPYVRAARVIQVAPPENGGQQKK